MSVEIIEGDLFFFKDLKKVMNGESYKTKDVEYEYLSEGKWKKTKKFKSFIQPDIMVKKTECDLEIQSYVNIKWKDPIVVLFKVKENIIFEYGAKFCYTGSSGGGLILWSSSGTIKTKSGKSDRPLDFSESSGGAVSIFYNPVPNQIDNNKYNNPSNFSSLISKSTNVYFKAFMLVHNKKADFDLVKTQKKGYYALSEAIDTREPLGDFSEFSGCLNLNYHCFYLRGFPMSEGIIFKNCPSPLWGKKFLYASPPLYGTPKGLFNLSKYKNEKLSEHWQAKAFVCVNGADLKTPLHRAAEEGDCEAIKIICKKTLTIKKIEDDRVKDKQT